MKMKMKKKKKWCNILVKVWKIVVKFIRLLPRRHPPSHHPIQVLLHLLKLVRNVNQKVKRNQLKNDTKMLQLLLLLLLPLQKQQQHQLEFMVVHMPDLVECHHVTVPLLLIIILILLL